MEADILMEVQGKEGEDMKNMSATRDILGMKGMARQRQENRKKRKKAALKN